MNRAETGSAANQVRNVYVHSALFYGSDDEYLATLVPFVTDGLALGQPVAVAVPGERLRVLSAALNGAADGVKMVDMTVAGRNPGRIIPSVLRRFADRHAGVHVRIIGEPIWAGRTAVEYPACVQHEALINYAFAGRDVTIVCPYDTEGLDDRALADAHATHPELWSADRRRASPWYAPDVVLDRYNQPLQDAAADADGLAVTSVTEVAAARRFATERASHLGLGDEQIPDLRLIVTELVTNSLVHTDGGCRLRVWHDHGHLICEVRDTGRLTDPLAGRHPALEGQKGGRGLLLVHELADLVRTHTSPHGTTIHALLRL